MDVLLTSHNFFVSLTRSTVRSDSQTGAAGLPASIGTGGFQEVTGLEVEMATSDIEEGGRNDALFRRIGRAKYQPLICKRGMFRPSGGVANYEIWDWFQKVVGGALPVPRYSGSVSVYDSLGAKGEQRSGERPEEEAFVAVWHFERAIPGKIVGPQLNASTGAVAIEELHLVHEGLYLGGRP